MDAKIFNELKNRRVITLVHLQPESVKDIWDVIQLGCGTSVSALNVYEDIVKNDESTKAVITEFLEAIAKGGNVVLPADIIIDAPIIIEKNVNIDLNGHMITVNPWTEEDGSTNSYAFCVKKGKLTLNGEGTVSANASQYAMAVWANGGSVEINGGNYYNAGKGSDLIYASGKSSIVINDGYFEPCVSDHSEPGTKEDYSTLNIKDKDVKTSSIKVYGGKFFGFNPADNLSENPKVNFVADGYESVADGQCFIVRKAEIVNPIIEPVEVKGDVKNKTNTKETETTTTVEE